jgi:hypothetical protein
MRHVALERKKLAPSPVRTPAHKPSGLEQAAQEAGAGSAGTDDFSEIPLHAPTKATLSSGFGASQPLPYRTRMEAAFGEDFSSVRAYSGSATALAGRDASAVAARELVLFARDRPPPGLVAHELAHVVQRRRAARRPESARSDVAAEREAGQAAAAVARGNRFSVAHSPAAVLSFSPKNPFDDAASWKDAAGAAKALEDYKALSAAERRAAVSSSYKRDLIRVLAALAPADKVGKYADAIREITRWVEEEETRASSGMNDDQIAAEQAKFIRKQAEDAAKAAAAAKAPKGKPPPPPSAADIEVERTKQVQATSIPPAAVNSWDAMPAADQAKWTARGNAAIAKVVTHVQAKHPELGITATKFRLAFKDVEQRGSNVVAFGEPDGAGGTRAAVGFSFTTAVELDPAYVVDVIVHEVYGHPEYGSYGSEYHLKLYDAAAAKIPGYVKPAAGSAARTTETDAYAYQETEMYAVLRSMQYRTAPKPADAAKVPNLDTKTLVEWHVGLMKQQWAPTLIVAILRGFRQRLVIDPRITAAALKVFDDAVLAKFDAATLAAVQK